MTKRRLFWIFVYGLSILAIAFKPTEVLAQFEEQAEEISQQQSQAKELEDDGEKVSAIEIVGNKTIGVSTILSKVKTRVGDPYRQNVISDDLKRLYNMGYFSDVSVDREVKEGGFKVIFYLQEKPIVEKISFTRLNYYNPRKLLIKLQTQEGKFLDQKLLKDDVQTIKDLYTKKGLTNVLVDVETEMDETTNKARIHFIIDEGSRLRVTQLRFSGSDSFSRSRLMRVIKSRPKCIWTLTPGYLKKDILKEDMDRLRAFYEREGFIDMTCDYQIEEISDGRLKITIAIDEGNQYRVGQIDIQNNDVINEQKILDTMEYIQSGNVFSRDKLAFDIDRIQSLYFDKGYIFSSVRESTVLDPQTGKVDVTLDIREGELAYLNTIKIQGNTSTRDIVIRRELRMYPGEKVDGEKLRRSKERLRNLGYFEEIGYDIESTDSPNRKDLVVQVKEAKTGSFSFGGGYSTVDQVVGFIEVEQKNFDFTNWPTFTGGGQHLSLRFEAGSLRNNARLSFTEPWLFDYPISAGFDVYRRQKLKDQDVGYAYDEKRTGGNLRLGKQFDEYLSGGVTYRNEEITIDNIDEDVTIELAREEGTNTVSMLTFHLARDTRDNVFSPKKGYRISSVVDWAGGALGGDKDFYRIQNIFSYYIPFKWESVVELRLKTGFADTYDDTEVVPIFERFFAGGSRSIRGYNERKVGPIDDATEDPIGGESLLVGNIEYTIPLVDFMKLAAFYDFGNVWKNVSDFGSGELKSGVGLGLRIRTPIGPVSLDYGYPLNDEPGEEKRQGKFYFSISRGF